MSLYTQTVKGIHRAPYRDQVLVELIRRGAGERLSPTEEAKVERVQRFLPAYQCADEIEAARNKSQ
jgi:hypothetical protein